MNQSKATSSHKDILRGKTILTLAKVFKSRLQILQITVGLWHPKLLISQICKNDLKVSKYVLPGLRGGGGRAAEARAAGDRQEEPRLGVQTLEAEPGELWLVETRSRDQMLTSDWSPAPPPA